MPRFGRVVLPGYPHHIIQRGHNRQVVFAEEADCRRYLDTLAEFKEVHGIKVYAWCLMTNHVHLLLEPGEEFAALGRFMKRLAGRQTYYHNRLEGRAGTLWESRYKSSPVDSNHYLLACIRYIELNPMRAWCLILTTIPGRVAYGVLAVRSVPDRMKTPVAWRWGRPPKDARNATPSFLRQPSRRGRGVSSVRS